MIYAPFTYAFLRLTKIFPWEVALIGGLFLGLAILFLLLVKLFESIIPNSWLRVGTSLVMIALPYPMIIAFDRGNIEIMLGPLVALGLYYFSRGRYKVGTACVLIAASCKIYALFFLIFLVRERKWGMGCAAAVAFLVIGLLSMLSLSAPLESVATHYFRNMANDASYEVAGLEESASPWVTYRLGVIVAQDYHLISNVEFESYDPFMRASYGVYQAGALAFILFFAVYACCIEKEFLRCAVLGLLFISAIFPSGADYRMVYACIALAIFVLIKTRRSCDWIILVLVALVMIPKKYYFFSLASYPEIPDVSIQVVLNPLFMLTAMALLIYDGFRSYDSQWAALRVRRYLSPFGLLRRPASQS